MIKFIGIFLLVVFFSCIANAQNVGFSIEKSNISSNKSINLSKINISDSGLNITCTFSKTDIPFVNHCLKNGIYIGNAERFLTNPRSSISETDTVNYLNLLFRNYSDTFINLDFFSNCDSCFYFKEIKLNRPWDVIVLTDQTVLKTIIKKSDSNLVKYYKYDDPYKTIFTLYLHEIHKIQFKDGTIITYIHPVPNTDLKETLTEPLNFCFDSLTFKRNFSIGVSLLGGGMFGIPIRLYSEHHRIVFDATIGLKPVMYRDNSTNTIEEWNIFYTGSINFYAENYSRNTPKKTKLNGFFVCAGGSSGNSYTEILGAIGWAYEQYKYENISFNINIGVGLIEQHDKNYVDIPWTSEPPHYILNPLIFIKIGWNTF